MVHYEPNAAQTGESVNTSPRLYLMSVWSVSYGSLLLRRGGQRHETKTPVLFRRPKAVLQKRLDLSPGNTSNLFTPPQSPITHGGPYWPGGLNRLPCPGEEERVF